MPSTATAPPSPPRDRALFGWRFMAPMLIGPALNPVNSSMIATALLPISRTFGVDAGSTAVLVAALYVASSIAQPTMGRLADLFGPRRVLVAGLLLVLVGGIVGGLAQSLDVLIVARVLIGIGTSAGYPTAMVLVRRRAEGAGIHPPGSVLGSVSVAGQVTAALGLPLGGVLVGLFGWRSTFLVNVPLAVLAIAMVLTWITADAPIATRRGARAIAADIDLVGLALFGVAISAVLVFLLSVKATPAWPWLGIGLLCGVALVAWELRQRAPFLDVRTLAANRPLRFTYVRAGGTALGMYLMLYGVTQWVQDGKGLSATAAGLVMLPMTACGAIASAIVSRRGLVRAPLIASAVAALAVAAGLAVVGVASPLWIVVALTLAFGLTVGLSSVGNQAALYVQAKPDQAGSAAGLLRTSTYLGAIASSTAISLIYDADGVTDAGLHAIAALLLVVNALVLIGTLADRHLPRRLIRTPEPRSTA